MLLVAIFWRVNIVTHVKIPNNCFSSIFPSLKVFDIRYPPTQISLPFKKLKTTYPPHTLGAGLCHTYLFSVHIPGKVRAGSSSEAGGGECRAIET